ncbi:GNAT family N-acetyltransferase [Chloroflexi bacterium]|nr:GNAT family N-acetyltransferase [Chloroflexota bacterium]
MIRISNFLPNHKKKLVEFINSVNESWDSPKELTENFFEQSINIPPSDPTTDCYLACIGEEIYGFIQFIDETPIKRLVGLQTIKDSPYFDEIFQSFIDLSIQRGSKSKAEVINFQISENDKESPKLFETNGWGKIKTYSNLRFEGPDLEELILPEGYFLRHFDAKNDIDTLTELQNLSFGTHWGFSPNQKEQIQYRIEMERTSDQGIIFIANNNRIAGYNWTMESHNETSAVGWVAMTGVHPDYRGLRLGRAVVLAGMHYLIAQNVHNIELEVDSENIPATNLYESIGFKKVSQTHWYQKDLLS